MRLFGEWSQGVYIGVLALWVKWEIYIFSISIQFPFVYLREQN